VGCQRGWRGGDRRHGVHSNFSGSGWRQQNRKPAGVSMATGGEIASAQVVGLQVEKISCQWIYGINLIAGGMDFLAEVKCDQFKRLFFFC